MNFKANAKKRWANVFVSRLEPGLKDDDLKKYLDDILKVRCSVERVKDTEWYSSFHIKCECEEPEGFMNSEIWPEGAYVRWWSAMKKQSRHSGNHSDRQA